MRQPNCVVVGAGPGLGLAIARRFARGGFDVALIGRDQGRLNSLSGTIESEGYCARGFAADAGSEDELRSAFAKIAEWNGDVGVLIFNAAVLAADSAPEMTARSMMEGMAVNLGGAICSVNQVLPAMRGRAHGTILVTGGGHSRWNRTRIGRSSPPERRPCEAMRFRCTRPSRPKTSMSR